MDNPKKRRIPRHVDGRFMVGTMHWMPFFFKFVPSVIFLAILLFSYFTPLTLFSSVVAGGVIFFMLSEINNRETGMDSFKSYLKYKKQGTIYYERSTSNATANFRYIRHREYKKEQGESTD